MSDLWHAYRGRPSWVQWLVPAVVLMVIAGALYAAVDTTNGDDESRSAATVEGARPEPATPPSVRQQLSSIVVGADPGDKVLRVDIAREGKRYAVTVDFDATESSTKGRTRGAVARASEQIYRAIYLSAQARRVSRVGITAFMTLTDKQGNESTERAYETALTGRTARRIDWDDVEPGGLDRLWTPVFIHPAIE